MILVYMRTHKNKKRGGYSAADYGQFVWGTNQTNNPLQGNVIQVANSPVVNARGGKKKGGDAHTDLMKNMTAEDIPAVVVSQSVTQTTPPVKGGRRTQRKKRHTRKSKRKY